MSVYFKGELGVISRWAARYGLNEHNLPVQVSLETRTSLCMYDNRAVMFFNEVEKMAAPRR
jgi:hypothetical protein